MTNSLTVILMIVVIAMVIANSSFGKAQTPNAIRKLKPRSNDWKKLLEWIPIIIIRIIVGSIFLLWRLVASGIRWATPNFFKKILKGF